MWITRPQKLEGLETVEVYDALRSSLVNLTTSYSGISESKQALSAVMNWSRSASHPL